MHISTPLRDRSSSPLLPEPSEPSEPGSMVHELGAHLASVGDLSSWSDELAAISTTWPLSYFLSPARANVLRGLPLPVDGIVLEIGSRAGAVTRYLGEEAALVDSLEPDAAMARVAATRCADLDTVVVHPVWLDSVPAEPVYDLVVAVDVLGELEQRQVTLEQFVAECRARLAPGGVLVLCADNADGVRRRAAGGLPPAPGVASPLRPSWITHDDLRGAADACGLRATVVSAFPDHRSTKVLFEHAALAAVDPHLVEALPSFPSPSYGAPVVQPELEGTLWSSLVRNGTADRSANSLVAVIGDAVPTLDAAATYWSLGRAAALSADNRIRLDDGTVVVERRHAFPRAPGPDGPLSMRPHTEAYVSGTSLVDRLLEASTATDAQRLLERWVDLVRAAAADGDVPWDLIPRNVVVDADDRLIPIDQEWALSGATATTVLQRGSFWLAADLLDAPSTPAWLRGRTHGQVADFIWRLAGQGRAADAPDDWLASFIGDEARATSFVSPLKPPRTRAHAARQNGRILSAISRSTTPHEPEGAEQQAPDTDAPSLQAVVDSLLATNEQLRDQLDELNRQRRHDALTQRDHVIGVTAELEVMRDRVGRAQAAQKLAMTKVRRLRQQVADMQASSTWRIGRTVVRPVARLRGRR